MNLLRHYYEQVFIPRSVGACLDTPVWPRGPGVPTDTTCSNNMFGYLCHVWNYPCMRKQNKHRLELECAAVVGGDLYLEPHHGPHHVGLADDAVTELATCRRPRLD